MTFKESKIRQLIQQSKAALQALNTDMLGSRAPASSAISAQASSMRPTSARAPVRSHPSLNRSKSSASFLRPNIIPLNKGKRPKITYKQTNSVHWAEDEVNESNRIRPRSARPIASSVGQYRTPKYQVFYIHFDKLCTFVWFLVFYITNTAYPYLIIITINLLWYLD